MSDISYVNDLGGALERAATTATRKTLLGRRGWGRRTAAVMLAVVGVGGGVALAGTLGGSGSEQLATSGVMCYSTAALRDGTQLANAGGVSAGGTLLPEPAGSSPARSCAQLRRLAGEPAVALVACDDLKGAIAVFPGTGAEACTHKGMRTLPAGYAAARADVAGLEAGLARLEARGGCVAPAALAARVQRLLEQSGWTGWHAVARTDLGSWPCGEIATAGGSGARSFGGAIDAAQRVVWVFPSPYPATARLVFSPHGAQLLRDSGRRCYDQAGIHGLVERWLAGSRRSVHFTFVRSPSIGGFDDGRERMLAAGCAVIVDVSPAADGYNLLVQILQRG